MISFNRDDDYIRTRSIVSKLDEWLNTLAGPYLPPYRVPEPSGGFHWEFTEHNEYTLLIAKAVRMVGGIRAALLLVDNGFVSESACLLRIVSDIAVEITAIVEGIKLGQPTTAQKEFKDQFFAPSPRTPDEYDKQEKKRYVTREELMKSLVRLANDAGLNGDHHRKLKRNLNKTYDDYVHGAYLTAMELYDGSINRFITGGVYWSSSLNLAKVCVSAKLHEVLCALRLMARAFQNESLYENVGIELQKLDSSENMK